MEIVFRRSKLEDKEQIRGLLARHFGKREFALENIENGKFLLALDNNKIIGMTGISNNKDEYDGYEIYHTALDIEYRGQGIISKMLIMEIERVGRNQNIYCNCWHRLNDDIYLKHAMEQLGFKLTIKNRIKYNAEHQLFCRKNCIYCDDKRTCYCYEDLYMLPAINK